MNFINLLSILSIFTIRVTSQLSVGPPPNIPACVVTCGLASCPSGGADLSCFCKQTAIATCIFANCPAADQATAQRLQGYCGVYSEILKGYLMLGSSWWSAFVRIGERQSVYKSANDTSDCHCIFDTHRHKRHRKSYYFRFMLKCN